MNTAINRWLKAEETETKKTHYYLTYFYSNCALIVK